jgi:hypothetical protein
MKRVQDGKKSLIDGCFKKGVDHGRPLGYIHTIFGLKVSLAGLPGKPLDGACPGPMTGSKPGAR